MTYEMKVFVEVDGRKFPVPDHVSKRLGTYTETLVERALEGTPSHPADLVEYAGTIAQERIAHVLERHLPEDMNCK